MGDAPPAWAMGMFRAVDARLREASKKAKTALRMLRLTVFLLVLVDLAIIVTAGLAIWDPRFIPLAIGVLAFAILVPVLAMTVLASLPLRWKSMTRIVDKGYPQNVKELVVRAAARKMRDESIESEELLLETAWNESRKLLKRYRQRAKAIQEEEAEAVPSTDKRDPGGSSTETLRPAP